MLFNIVDKTSYFGFLFSDVWFLSVKKAAIYLRTLKELLELFLCFIFFANLPLTFIYDSNGADVINLVAGIFISMKIYLLLYLYIFF